MTYIAYTLCDDRIDPVRVTVLRAHSWGWGQAGGYQVSDGTQSWFARHIWDTADEAARVAGDIAHDLDL